MNGKPNGLRSQRAGGWCEPVTASQGSARKRLAMSHDGFARYSGKSGPASGNLGGNAGETSRPLADGFFYRFIRFAVEPERPDLGGTAGKSPAPGILGRDFYIRGTRPSLSSSCVIAAAVQPFIIGLEAVQNGPGLGRGLKLTFDGRHSTVDKKNCCRLETSMARRQGRGTGGVLAAYVEDAEAEANTARRRLSTAAPERSFYNA